MRIIGKNEASNGRKIRKLAILKIKKNVSRSRTAVSFLLFGVANSKKQNYLWHTTMTLTSLSRAEGEELLAGRL
jgi:hypothetical protein